MTLNATHLVSQALTLCGTQAIGIKVEDVKAE